MEPKKILFIDSNHPLLHETLQQQGYTCHLYWDKPTAVLKDLIPEYDALVIRSKFKITPELLENAHKLKCIGRAGAGMENIDVDYAKKKGITCVHAPEGNRVAVGEHALAMLLALFNKLIKADREVRQGIWLREENRGIELSGKTVGIIGYGNTGSAFAKCLRGFDVNILAYDKYKRNYGDEWVKEADLNEIKSTADILSLHIPLTEETRNKINRDFLSDFKKNIFLINTARGKCLVTDHLVEALKSGKVKGACLDVLEYESVSFENLENAALPPAHAYLLQSDKVILSPHIAGWTHESNEKIARVLAKKMHEALSQ